MQKLINTLQNYPWGSKQALTQLYAIANPANQPMAELWMGAHPKSSSSVRDQQGNLHSLRDLINSDKTGYLGDSVTKRFAELPFLFKVLCAESPLSIQVHPDKAAAEAGYARENAQGIALDSPQRNYKDPNHKPELVFAITPFLAMNGFREFADIARALCPVVSAHPAIRQFIDNPDAAQLRQLFISLLTMDGQQKAGALATLHAAQKGQQQDAAWQAIAFIQQYFPEDNGLFAPLLLNVITLQPGEAMFLFARTPHAYLRGTALEVMANSDNVLRAGLTPKHIAIDELIASLDFVQKPAATLLTAPQQQGTEIHFPVPVADFAFSIHPLTQEGCQLTQSGAAILFCMEGNAQLSAGQQQLSLLPGESAFISASDPVLTVRGNGRLARAFNQPF